MNKELIKKYKMAFEHWLNGGEILHKDESNNWENSGDIWDLRTEKIKDVIVEMVHYTDEFPKVNYSNYISEKLHQDYTYLSNIFSEVKGITIQQYIINHKIERVKELLLYDELNLSEIAYLLNYSSVAHLSGQFKKVTGLTPSMFKRIVDKRRRLANNA